MRKPLDLGIAIRLDADVSDAADRLCLQLAQRAPLQSRIGPGYLPHLTLFQGRFPARAEGQVIDLFGRFARGSKRIEVNMLGRLALSQVGNVFWLAEHSPALLSLHLRAHYSFRPLTDRLLLPLFRGMQNDPRFDAARIERFGTLSAGERFEPHVTLCRLAHPERDGGLAMQVEAPRLPFRAQRLMLGRLGYNANLLKVVREEELGAENASSL